MSRHHQFVKQLACRHAQSAGTLPALFLLPLKSIALFLSKTEAWNQTGSTRRRRFIDRSTMTEASAGLLVPEEEKKIFSPNNHLIF